MHIALVNMPFGALRPAIGVNLLKAQLQRIGVRSQVLYLNLRFARLVGRSDYDYIADGAPSQCQAGDWLFARSVFGPREGADTAYLRTFPERFAKFRAPSDSLAALTRCRRVSDSFLQACLDEIDWSGYDLIGFTSTFTQHVASIALARRLKERFPKVKIAFGGANCEAQMGFQLNRSFCFVDFVCGGEADLSFPQLIESLKNGGDCPQIPGVISRHNDDSQYVSLTPERIKNLDDLPYPEYDDYCEQLASSYPSSDGRVVLLMESSRGCWWGEKHHCTFCGLNGTSMTFPQQEGEAAFARDR